MTKGGIEIDAVDISLLMQSVARVEAKLDVLLAQDRPSDTPHSTAYMDDDDEDWIKGLDPMTRFNLERGWTTKEEVRKALREE
ncbi:hypothetical protein [Methylocystis sp. S23]